MNTTTSVLLTGAIVVVGRWSQDEKITPRIVVGVIFLALILSLMSQSNAKLANQFGLLVLLTATLGYSPTILKKMGYMK